MYIVSFLPSFIHQTFVAVPSLLESSPVIKSRSVIYFINQTYFLVNKSFYSKYNSIYLFYNKYNRTRSYLSLDR